jgi:hypothetical protein
MGNCDSCIGQRAYSKTKSFDEPVQHTPSSASSHIGMKNEIQYASGGNLGSPGFGANYRIVPFDRRPSIKIPDPLPEKPRKPYGI